MRNVQRAPSPAQLGDRPAYANRIQRPVVEASLGRGKSDRVLYRAKRRPPSYRDSCHQKVATAQQFGQKFGRIQSLPSVRSFHQKATP
jgi:hypothetical protein